MYTITVEPKAIYIHTDDTGVKRLLGLKRREAEPETKKKKDDSAPFLIHSCGQCQDPCAHYCYFSGLQKTNASSDRQH